MAKKSNIWKHFLVKGEREEKAECKLCPNDSATKTLIRGKSSKSFSTKPLWNHMKSKHPKEYSSLTANDDSAVGEDTSSGASVPIQSTIEGAFDAGKKWNLNDKRSLEISRKIGK
jgi:hypothetical protein